MKIPRTGEMSSSMAVLGLVVQRPDTIAGVAYRLSEMFPRARWSAGAAHSSMPSLAEQGLLQVVQKGSAPTLDRYEATSVGVVSSLVGSVELFAAGFARCVTGQA